MGIFKKGQATWHIYKNASSVPKENVLRNGDMKIIWYVYFMTVLYCI